MTLAFCTLFFFSVLCLSLDFNLVKECRQMVINGDF